MTTVTLHGNDEADSPISYTLARAVDAVFRNLSLNRIEFTRPPQAWFQSAPEHHQGIRTERKQRMRYEIAERDGSTCAYCGLQFFDVDLATLDHVIPKSVVQHWEPWNLVLSCGPCNQQKDNRIPAALMPLISHLLVALLPLAQQEVARRAEKKAARLAAMAQVQAAAQNTPSTTSQDGAVA